jgi:pyruvate/2-oxoglutarate dehydrogenase complex dihydrolipoamide acyltransferase (E2) component
LIEVKVPQIGETVGEITITKWLKEEGRKVIKGEPLFEIMTSKINIEVKAEVSGILYEILAKEGSIVSVGEIIAKIEGSEKE